MGKTLIFIFLFCLFSFPALARPVEERDVVKLYSRVAKTNLWREGSGVILQNNGKIFVITSYHVAYNSNEGYESFVLLDGKKIPITWEVSDWAKGLSLFAATAKPQADYLDWVSLASNDPISPQVKGLGFPFNQDEIYSLDGLLAKDSPAESDMFLDVPKIVKVEEMPSELGMSGGALVDVRGAYLGLLSHQKEIEGKFETFVIPGKIVSDWLREVFQGKFKAIYQTDPARIDENSISLRGQGWSIGCSYFGGETPITFIDQNTEGKHLKPVPQMIDYGRQLKKRGDETNTDPTNKGGQLLHSHFYFLGFRPLARLDNPKEVILPKSNVQILRQIFSRRQRMMFVNTGSAAQALSSVSFFFWRDIWKPNREQYQSQMGARLFASIDGLVDFTSERAGLMRGLVNELYPGLFTYEELQNRFYAPEFDEDWQNLETKNPMLALQIREYGDKILAAHKLTAFTIDTSKK